MKHLLIACLVFLFSMPGITGRAAGVPDSESGRRVSAQGIIRQTASPLIQSSPLGHYRMKIEPIIEGMHRLAANLQIMGKNGTLHRLENIRGHAFFISDAGRLVTIQDFDSNLVPSRLAVLNLEGRELAVRLVEVLSDPGLSPDGMRMVYRMRTGVTALNLMSLEAEDYPLYDLFAAGPAGRLAGFFAEKSGQVTLYSGRKEDSPLSFDGLPRRMAFSRDGLFFYLMTGDQLIRWSLADRRQEILFSVSQGSEIRDLLVTNGGIRIGLRHLSKGTASGEQIIIDPEGQITRRDQGPSKMMPKGATLPPDARSIPWPLGPDEQHSVGITYGEFQNYAGQPGTAYMHAAMDIMGTPGDPVYAVKDGVVKAVLTTSDQYNWRIAIGDSATSGTCDGYLYAHLNQSSIAVNVGDPVVQGQYIGDVVTFFSNFHHIHFSKIRGTGINWNGRWTYTGNPHLEFEHQDETRAPDFRTAIDDQPFAFCYNETDVYLDPAALQGRVDIICLVQDRIESPYPCTVQELRYSIYPAGHPESPVVDDKLAVFYNMALDSDQYPNNIDGRLVNLLYKQDDTCASQMDLQNFAYYHILTNSDGDQNYEDADRLEAWDTAAVPDGDYVIEVTAVDAAGNVATESMQVSTLNGHTGSYPETRVTMGPQGPASAPVLTFVFTGHDDQDPPAALRFSHRLDNGEWSPYGSATTAALSGLSPGSHVFRVRARDTGGNVDPVPAIRSFVVNAWENRASWSSMVTGPGPGPYNPPLVRTAQAEWLAYGVSRCGVNVACGDLDGSGPDEVITGPGPAIQYGPHVRGFEADGTPVPGVSFLAYGTPKFGANVAGGDVDGDGYDEIMTGAGPGAVFGPHVRGWNCDGGPAVPIREVSYMAYGTRKYGVNAVCGDVDNDGYDEIMTGAGPGAVFGPHVRGWNYDGGSIVPIRETSFMAYGTSKFGVNVACGDVDNDGYDEIITGAGPGVIFSSHVRGWNYDGAALAGMVGLNFFDYTGSRYGVHVSTANVDGDPREEILTMPGPDPSWPAHVRAWDFSQNNTGLIRTRDFIAYDRWMTHGGKITGGNIN